MHSLPENKSPGHMIMVFMQVAMILVVSTLVILMPTKLNAMAQGAVLVLPGNYELTPNAISIAR
jgi:hypothetical protein